MTIIFKRSRGYSLPSFEINQTTAYSNQQPSNSQHYNTNKQHLRETQQSHTKPEKSKSWECQGDHLKKDCPMVKASKGKAKHPRFQGKKERQDKILKSIQKSLTKKEVFTS